MGTVDTTANIAACNRVLGMIGAEDIVLDTDSTNRTYCETYFARAYKEILASHFWNFASKRAFAIQTTGPLFGYDNAFTIPSDCIRLWKIADDPEADWRKVGTVIHTDEGEAASDWETATAYIVGQYVSNDDVTYVCIAAHTSASASEPGTGADTATYWTSQSGDYEILAVEYVYDFSTLASWPSYALQCFDYNFAVKLLPPIKQNEEAAVNFQKLLYDPAVGMLAQAKCMDAQESGVVRFEASSWEKSRR